MGKGNTLTSVSAITMKWTNNRWCRGWERTVCTSHRNRHQSWAIWNRILVRKQAKSEQAPYTHLNTPAESDTNRAAGSKCEATSKRDSSQFKQKRRDMCVVAKSFAAGQLSQWQQQQQAQQMKYEFNNLFCLFWHDFDEIVAIHCIYFVASPRIPFKYLACKRSIQQKTEVCHVCWGNITTAPVSFVHRAQNRCLASWLRPPFESTQSIDLLCFFLFYQLTSFYHQSLIELLANWKTFAVIHTRTRHTH